MKSLRTKIIISISIVMISIIITLLLIVSCKKDASSDNIYVLEDEDIKDEVVTTDELQQADINWEEERLLLKNVGKLNVEIFSKIAVIIKIDLDNKNQSLSDSVYTSKQKTEILMKERIAILAYFGLSEEVYDQFYKDHEQEITIFISTNPAYSDKLEAYEGVSTEN